MKAQGFRFTKAAFQIKTNTASQKGVLLVLGHRADNDTGVCHPSYERIMHDTSIRSEDTVKNAIQYLRNDLGVVTWVRGWGNAHRSRANTYTLDYEAMLQTIEKQRLVVPITPDAIPITPSSNTDYPCLEIPIIGTLTSHDSTTHITTTHALNSEPKSTDVDFESGSQRLAIAAHMEEIPIIGNSKNLVEIPQFLEWDTKCGEWVARRGIGRGLTTEEIADKRRLNFERVTPERAA